MQCASPRWTLRQSLVLTFVILQCGSVLLGSLPARDTVSHFLNTLPEPYLRLTGQWQNWNLFAPDPVQEVTNYVVVIEESGVRHTRSIGDAAAGWNREDIQKVLRDVAKPGEIYAHARNALLHSLCAHWYLATGAELTLFVHTAPLADPSAETVIRDATTRCP